MDRRTFICRSGSTFASGAVAGALVSTPIPASAVVQAVISKKSTDLEQFSTAIDNFTEKDWLTITTVQNHLFPSEPDAPGSVEIKALSYLHDFLSNTQTDPETVQFILSGSRLLQVFTQQTFTPSNASNAALFTDLSTEQREKILRQFEQQPEGRRWLVNILNYVLEALLTDPVYGGNPDGIGWKWLEHTAGNPRPPANKRYWLL